MDEAWWSATVEALVQRGFDVIQAVEHPEVMGSRYTILRRSGTVRLVWDGRDAVLSTQVLAAGDPSDPMNASWTEVAHHRGSPDPSKVAADLADAEARAPAADPSYIRALGLGTERGDPVGLLMCDESFHTAKGGLFAPHRDAHATLGARWLVLAPWSFARLQIEHEGDGGFTLAHPSLGGRLRFQPDGARQWSLDLSGLRILAKVGRGS